MHFWLRRYLRYEQFRSEFKSVLVHFEMHHNLNQLTLKFKSVLWHIYIFVKKLVSVMLGSLRLKTRY